MMNEDPFDQKIRNSLNQHQSQPPADMWSRIMADMQEQRKSRRWIWMVPILSLTILITAAWLLGLFSYENSIDNIDHIHTEKSTIVQPSDETLVPATHGQLNESQQESNNNSDITLLSSEENDAEWIGQEGQAHNALLSADDKVVNNTQNQRAIQSKSAPNHLIGDDHLMTEVEQDHVNTRIDGHTTEQDRRDKPTRLRQDESSESGTDNRSDDLSNQRSNLNRHDNLSTELADDTKIAEVDADNRTKVPGKATNSYAWADIGAAPLLNTESPYLVELMPAPRNSTGFQYGHFVYDPCSVRGNSRKSRQHCYTLIRRSQNIFADLTVGSRYAAKSFLAKSDEALSLRSDRLNSETPLFGLIVNARAGIKWRNNIIGITGIQYAKVFERFHYYNPREERTTLNISIRDTIVDAQTGQIEYRYDTTYVTSVGERRVKHTNSITRINVPITIGYMWELDKLQLGIHGGILANLYFGQSGRVIDADGSVASLSGDHRRDIYKMNAGLGITGSAFIAYEIQRDLYFLVEPQFSYDLGSITQASYDLEQRYLSIGLNIGVRMKLTETYKNKKKLNH